MGRRLVPAIVSLALALPLSPSLVWAAPSTATNAAPSGGGGKSGKSKKKKGKSKADKGKAEASKADKAEGTAADEGASSTVAEGKDGKASKAADDAVPEPPASGGAPLQARPLELSGKLAKDTRKGLEKRFSSAVAGVTVATGGHEARMSVKLTGKRSYALVLAVLGSDDAVVLELQDSCEGCSLDQVGERMQTLLQQAATKLDEPKAPAPGSVAVRSTPEGATVRVDGAEHGVTPQVIELAPGEHALALAKEGFAPFEQTVVVEEGAQLPVEVTLTAAAPAVGPKPDKGKGKVPDGPDPGRGLKIGGAVVLSAGLAGVAAGVAMILIDEQGVAGCSGQDVDFRGECRNRYDTLLGGIIGTAAGGLGVAGGLAMLIQGQRVTVRARGGKQQASISVSVRF